ncbi:MAG: sugar ABC transporter permease [Propionibacteriaceae bacterium]|jgi:multiple sugar transport system permease protein|nr:sugar ABC transporter permease [Propionibacteriaceae bacterium]
MVGFLGLTAVPILASLYFAFTDYDLFDAPQWIGLGNFVELFDDPRFLTSVRTTAVYVAAVVPLKLGASLGVALLLARRRRGSGLYRAAFYLPSLIGASVSLAIVWKALFSDGGAVDTVQRWFGVDVGGWAGNPSLATLMLVLLAVWQFGAPMVIFLAGLLQVPRELYEAADIDGAGPWQRFIGITLPSLSPVLLFNLVLETIAAFQVFASAFIVSNGLGGPAGATNVYTLYLYQQAFGNLRMGYASAMAWIMLVTVALVTLAIFRSARNWVHYEDAA